tara:strand:+ start:153 stop:437 length:285 start_codon:yes stop_codon:yes gene_type:complete
VLNPFADAHARGPGQNGGQPELSRKQMQERTKLKSDLAILDKLTDSQSNGANIYTITYTQLKPQTVSFDDAMLNEESPARLAGLLLECIISNDR